MILFFCHGSLPDWLIELHTIIVQKYLCEFVQVQKPAMQWETVVVSELHIRLKTSGLPVQVSNMYIYMFYALQLSGIQYHELASSCVLLYVIFVLQSFVNAEETFVYNDASVMVLPHYKHGSLLVRSQYCSATPYFTTIALTWMDFNQETK